MGRGQPCVEIHVELVRVLLESPPHWPLSGHSDDQAKSRALTRWPIGGCIIEGAASTQKNGPRSAIECFSVEFFEQLGVNAEPPLQVAPCRRGWHAGLGSGFPALRVEHTGCCLMRGVEWIHVM